MGGGDDAKPGERTRLLQGKGGRDENDGGVLRALSGWWCCCMTPHSRPELSRVILIFAFLMHTYIWQGGSAAFIVELIGSRGSSGSSSLWRHAPGVLGGFHTFEDALTSPERHVHPKVMLPFRAYFALRGCPEDDARAVEVIAGCLRSVRSLCLLSWIAGALLLLHTHLCGARANLKLRVAASSAVLLAAVLHFYLMGFDATAHDPVICAWVLLLVAVAQVADCWCVCLRTRARSRAAVCVWSQKAVLALLCLQYFLAACYKLRASGLSWMDGHVMQFYMHEYLYDHRALLHWFGAPGLCQVLSVGRLAFETFCPVACFCPRLTVPVVAAAMLVHLIDLCLVDLKGSRFVTWIWALAFVIDLPASIVPRGLGTDRRLKMEGRVLALEDVEAAGDEAEQEPYVQFWMPGVERLYVAPSRTSPTASALAVGMTAVCLVWLVVVGNNIDTLRKATYPWTAVDMFSRIGSWSRAVPFETVTRACAVSEA